MTADPVRELLRARVRAGAMPGAVWRVEVGDDAPSAGAVGDAAVAPVREPVSSGTPYDLASLTKPLATALLAVLLERDGAIDLEAPVAGWLPALSGTRWARTTALDLGAHRAGLPAWLPLYAGGGGIEAWIARIASAEPAGEPGSPLYSDLGYLLLGRLVEIAGGAPLDALFRTRVAAPLGLEGAIGYARDGRGFERAAPTEAGNAYERRLAGRDGSGFEFRTTIPRGEVHDGNAHALHGVAGHAGLFGTAAAVAALAREILVPTRLGLDAPGRRRLLDVGPDGRSFGFVAAAASDAARDVLADDAPGHTGFTGTSIWLEPARGRVYVLLTNRVHPEVPTVSFQPVRRAFHAAAAAVSSARR